MGQFDIDAVLTWVDGNDPVWRRRKNEYLKGTSAASFDDIAGDTRYASIGEVRYCVSSLLRFAPFLRKIFIVTPAQNPNLDEFLEMNFPGHATAVEVVDQDTLFAGEEDCLPVFNSLSVESMLWKIPDLCEHFIYLNDDFLLVSPLKESDFFTEDGRPVSYAEQKSILAVKLWGKIKPLFHGRRKFGLKDAMVNAADALGGQRTYLYFGHTPNAMLKSLTAGFDASHPGVIKANANHRFRDPSQFHPQELNCLLAREAGLLEIRPYKGQYLYYKPRRNDDNTEAVAEMLASFNANTSAKFCCFNSLDRATERVQEMVKAWMCARTGIKDV